MKPEPNNELDQYRVDHPLMGPSPAGANYGAFNTGGLQIISSGVPDPGDPGEGWEHVSVSRRDRCPTWEEMCRVKDLFWLPEETVIQFHPKASKYKNVHKYCLHMWRRVGSEHELPPLYCV